MKSPNLGRIIETFIRIERREEAIAIQVWQDYLDLLRSKVAPLVGDLLNAGIIDWYSFLVHDRASGVPTSESDPDYYVHLRMGLTDTLNESGLTKQLPSWCLMTQKMRIPHPPSLDGVDVQSLNSGKVEQGWKTLGEASEWVLNMLKCHDPNKPIPMLNVAQFLHYIGNQLFVKAVRIPMP